MAGWSDGSFWLVAFEVYPVGCAREIQLCLYHYVLQLADDLGIRIHFPSDQGDSYQIENLLSESWYDDGAIRLPEAFKSAAA